MTKKIGCIFGSFNPIHSGHVHLAEKVLEKTDMDEVWFVISPQNPFKIDQKLVDEKMRKEMVYLMTETNHRIKICDIEFDLPKPSYSYITINALNEKYPENEFHFIIGTDALNSIQKWKNYQEVIKTPFITFIRNNEQIKKEVDELINNRYTITSESNISSTFIRNHISWGQIDDILKLNYLNKNTVEYIKNNNLYNYGRNND